MQGVLYRQTTKGQEVYEWDTTKNHGGPLDPCHARKAFNEAMRSGWEFAFATSPSGESTQIRAGEFDPETQSKVTMIHSMAGGC